MKLKIVAVAAMCAAASATAGAVFASTDVGVAHEDALSSHSEQYFGVGTPLDASSSASISQDTARAHPTALVTLAKGLKVRVITANVIPPNIDQMVLWPNDAQPRYIIACNEQESTDPGLIRVDISTGSYTTIVTGTVDCDPVRRTPWGTILFGEEAGGGPNGGAMYEILDPVYTTGVTLDRTTGVFSGGRGSDGAVRRDAMGRLSYEGLAMYPNGVVYYGDENRPSSGTPGGAYFKFIPSHLRASGAGAITALDQSPLAAGSVYGLRLGRRSGGTDYGQGTQSGKGTWVPVTSGDLRAQAAALKLTGYYRPEDLETDQKALAAGNARMCGNNTGNETDDQYWGETICITDGTVGDAAVNAGVPQVQQLVTGSPALAMPDNIAQQPNRPSWIVHEDADTTAGYDHNDDLWDCLDDGADADLQSDGCIRIGTLNDLTAEWTGGFFTDNGKVFVVSVQHNISGYGTILAITGWK